MEAQGKTLAKAVGSDSAQVQSEESLLPALKDFPSMDGNKRDREKAEGEQL